MIRHMMTFALLAASLIVGGCDSNPGPDDSAATMGAETDAVASSSSEADSTDDAGSSGSSGGEPGDGSVEDFGPCQIDDDCQSGICKGDPRHGGNMCSPAPCVNSDEPDYDGQTCLWDDHCLWDEHGNWGDFECRRPPNTQNPQGFCTEINVCD